MCVSETECARVCESVAQSLHKASTFAPRPGHLESSGVPEPTSHLYKMVIFWMVSPSSPASGNPEQEPVSSTAEGTQPKGQPVSQTAGLCTPHVMCRKFMASLCHQSLGDHFQSSTMEFCSPQYIVFYCGCQVRVIHAVKKTGYIHKPSKHLSYQDVF